MSSSSSRFSMSPARGFRVRSRMALILAGLIGVSLSSPSAGAGQSPALAASPESGQWEIRVPGGLLVPTGDQRHALGDAHVTAVQVSRVLGSRFAMTGSFAWARSRDLASVDAPKLDVFTSDLGVEVRSAEMLTDGPVAVSLFAGLGAGLRSYNHRSLHVDATHNVAGYGAVGGELGMGRVGLRLEVRDYVSGFEPLIGPGTSEVRNDMVMTLSLRFNRQRASQSAK